MLNKNDINYLNKKSRHIRKLILQMMTKAGAGHIGGAASIVEVLVVLYYKVMNIDPEHPKMPERDRFVLSKGHAGPALYAVLADKGYFGLSELDTLNQPDTNLPSHCDMKKTVGVDMTAGSLGQGFSAAVGMAIGAKIDHMGIKVYTVIGDGESQEGQIWEAAMLASQQKLDNLIAFLDRNNMQIDGTLDEIVSLDPADEKWRAFGWNVQEVNGHNAAEIFDAVQQARKCSAKPSMIILNTIKGKDISFAENKVSSHHMNISQEQCEIALKELNKNGGGENDG